MRKYYIDNIRWMTVVCVVIYHVIFLYNAVAPELGVEPFREVQWQDGIQYVLYPWFMILLFLIAGMCSRYYLERHSVKEFVRSRTRRLLVPSTIGVLVFGWVQGYVSMSISNAFETIPDTVPAPVLYFIMAISGIGVLWFIQLLWIFSMVLALVRKFEKGRLYAWTEKAGIVAAVLLGIPVYFSGLVLNTPVVTVYRFGIYGLCFFLGYFVFAHDEVTDRISKYRIPLLALSAVLAGVYLFLHFGDNFAAMPTMGSVPAVAFAWATVLAILGSARAWLDRETRFSKWMTEREFGLYVFHYLPLSATAYLLHTYTSLPALPSYLLTGIAAFAGALLLYECFSRIPGLRWCVLGIKTDKKTKDK